MYHYLEEGGIFMWPIFALLLLSSAIILEKLHILFIKQKSINVAFKNTVKAKIKAKKFQELNEYLNNYNNSIAVVLKQIINEDDEITIEQCYQNEIKRLEHLSYFLGISITIAPQLGLLGTVTGMIQSFKALSNADESVVASGISQALLTTAFGLCVAIFALFFHIIFNKKIDYLNNEIYLYLNNLIKAKNEKN